MINFRQFLERINYSNGLYVIPKPHIKTNSIYYEFRVKRGNNSIVITNVLKNRWWWTKAEKGKGLDKINFHWVSGRNHKYLKILEKNTKLSYNKIRVKYISDIPRSVLNPTPSTANCSNRTV
jgi:hypothetical protein